MWAKAAIRSATSRCAGRNGTARTATPCAISGAATQAASRDLAYRLTGSSRPLPGRRPPAVGEHQLRHGARRVHASRPGHLQREAQRGQRRGQPTTAPTTTVRGTAASRATTDDPGIAGAARPPAAQPDRHGPALAGLPDDLGGDEIGRTQHGNNNAYCQDNEISWLDWDHVDEAMLRFVQRIVAFRRERPVLRRKRFFSGEAVRLGKEGHHLVLPSGRSSPTRTGTTTASVPSG